MSRERSWRRHKDYVKALRKRELDLSVSWWSEVPADPLKFDVSGGMYKNLHQYSKNKIHCSCPSCSAKTRNKSYRRRHLHANYSPSINYCISDLRKVQSMNYNEVDFLCA